MRVNTYLLLAFSSFLALVVSFSPQDHEIFRLHDELTTAEGKGITFYDFIGVKPSASQDEISKSYRKKSRTLHPDKAKQNFIAARAKKPNKATIPGTKPPKTHVNKPPSAEEIKKETKIAQARYARLGVIAEILKGSGRERYDFFLANGFPTWRGTGYYYARYRPGLGTVIFGLFLFGGGLVHYAAMYLSWKRQRDFVGRYIRHARRAAWGDETGIQGIPGLGSTLGQSEAPQASALAQENGQAVLNRRQKRMQEKEAQKEARKEKKGGKASSGGVSTPSESEPEVTGPQGSKKKVQAENGKVLIVDSVGNVFLEEANEDGETAEFLLDPDEIPRPTYRDTVVFRLPAWAFRKIQSKVFGKTTVLSGHILGTKEDDVDAKEEQRSGKVKSKGRKKG
ncbi:uncharacterized protein KY384_009134 [Bacidia gigantensis]|uniref:uncharacterized protein n=1 Tax=Bacidia gigantensis TaxID=2732470 RepID=UPI001D059691|nr:uncharacterized protein KY384_009134 [Bacidia gigantensis]KAG8525490.1 hypothetical protein KY384_009134 [Bacidia gigantensis]